MTSPAGRYAVSALAPSTEAETSVVCIECGVLVASIGAHDEHHAMLAGLAPAKPKAVTRGKA